MLNTKQQLGQAKRLLKKAITSGALTYDQALKDEFRKFLGIRPSLVDFYEENCDCGALSGGMSHAEHHRSCIVQELTRPT